MPVRIYGDERGLYAVLQEKGIRVKKRAPAGMPRREAARWLDAECRAEMERRRRPALTEGTLSDFCAKVLPRVHRWSPRTWRQRQYKVVDLMSELGHLKLDELRTPVVKAFLTKLGARGIARGDKPARPMGPSAVADYHKTLAAIWELAREEGYTDGERPWRLRLKPVTLQTTREPWTEAQEHAFMAAAKHGDPEMGEMARFILLSGMRPEEVLKARVADLIDVPAPALAVHGKGLRERVIERRGAFAKLLTARGVGRAFFFGPDGGTRRYLDWPQKRWERVCKAAGIPSLVYVLRHTFICREIDRGVNVYDLAKHCGTSVAVIQAHYDKRRAVPLTGGNVPQTRSPRGNRNSSGKAL